MVHLDDSLNSEKVTGELGSPAPIHYSCAGPCSARPRGHRWSQLQGPMPMSTEAPPPASLPLPLGRLPGRRPGWGWRQQALLSCHPAEPGPAGTGCGLRASQPLQLSCLYLSIFFFCKNLHLFILE
uniref:Uncharacterized protein n=1 Tax=Rousettus aegyptiacus TaxID=9407 RepID=A0A7J8CHT3_ROUAE|nr:hypothetical protein HJG63_008924 [Rousettus aegyptiacus]